MSKPTVPPTRRTRRGRPALLGAAFAAATVLFAGIAVPAQATTDPGAAIGARSAGAPATGSSATGSSATGGATGAGSTGAAPAPVPEIAVVGGTVAFGAITGLTGELVVSVASPDGVVAAVSPGADGLYRFSPAIAGEYTVAFSATDAEGGITEQTRTVVVSGEGPESPVAPEASGPSDAAANDAGAADAAEASDAAATGEPDVRFAAIGDIHNSWSELAEAYDFWAAEDVSTALFVGDLTNNATASEYAGLKSTVDAKAGLGIELVASLGNHDVAGIASYDLFTQATGGQKPNADYTIEGYHFITVSPGAGTLDPETGKPSSASSGNYAYAAAWLQQRLAAATAEDPTKPVMVLVHHPLRCTHYVSNEWYGTGLASGCGDTLQSVFDDYPQAVVWGGHIHTPQNIPTSVWQGQEHRTGDRAGKGFTTVNAPPLAYYEFESGVVNTSPTSRSNDTTPDDAGNNRQTAIVEITGSQVTIKNYDLLADRWIDQTWSWDVADSVDTTKSYDERFPLNNTHRASLTDAPQWPAGAAVQVDGIGEDKAMVAFPQAVPAPNPVQDIVHKYRYTTNDVATGQTVNTFLQWSGFYNLPMPTSRAHEVWNLRPAREYEVRVTPINAWGKEGAPLTARFTTTGSTGPVEPPFDPDALTFDDLREPVPAADLLDVRFVDGTAKDASPKAWALTAGSAARVIDDADLGAQVAIGRQGTASAFRTANLGDADYAKLQDGFTIDATFRIDAIDKPVGGYVDVVGGMQSGGIGLEAVRTASAETYELGFWYASPRPSVQLEYGTWYHVTGWYDGTDARLYVGGAKAVATTDVSFPVKPSNAAARYLAIGGDANPGGTLDDATFNGRIAGVELYSTPLSEKNVYRVANRELKLLDATPPQVQVAPAPGAVAIVGRPYFAPAPQAVDNSGRVEVAVEVTDPAGAVIEVTRTADGRHTFVPTTPGAHTITYLATDAAARQAHAAFTVTAADGSAEMAELLEPLPVADLLDLGYTGGKPADRSPRAHAVTAGNAAISVDPELGGEVATFTGNSAQGSRIAWSDADYAKTEDGFAIESVFKVPSITTERDMISNTQTAGQGLEMLPGTQAGKVSPELWVRVGGRYVVARAENAVTAGRWTHVVATYDAASGALRIYVDGREAGTAAATGGGKVQNPSGAARAFVVGGDISSSGTVEYPFEGAISTARIFSEPVAAKAVSRLAANALKRNDTTPPLLEVDPAPAATATVGEEYSVPAGIAGDDSGSVTVAITVSGPIGEDVPIEPGTIVPPAVGTYTLTYTALDAAGNVTEAAFEVVATEPAPVATVAPSLTGTARVGGILFARPGEWNAEGLAFAYRWTADGEELAGETGAELRLAGEHNGAEIAVEVTATRAGAAPGTATSPAIQVEALPAWRAEQVYLAGDEVLDDGRVYMAQWWTRGTEPGSTVRRGTAHGAWAERGVEVVTPQGVVPTWTGSWIYTGGETVAHEGRLYRASWWTRGQEPGAVKHSAWEDLGAF
ncbi:LamG-like jellyroll fold domain-containing protein [Agromyces agglutinans]|uniref:LamG-like jellyroll fold domain-containing protein n=1 Tax=Agromyces agglutinans TaxID=2662258 RepID=UPI001C12C5F6|nr:LamG-like jellyroll fold domain-containing protein [Agromyces agglutinans]